MNTADPTTDAGRTQIWSSAIAAVAHGALALLLLRWETFLGTVCAESFQRWEVTLPELTSRLVELAVVCRSHFGMCTILLILFVFVDFAILLWLSQANSSRILRELWAALVTAVPLALIAFGSISVIWPFLLLLDGAR